MRRERLATAIGEKVENVIALRMEMGEEKLAHAAGAFTEMNSLLGATIAYRLQGYELPANRRAHVRLSVDLEATLDGAPCQVWDISLGGANIITSTKPREIVGEQQLTIPIHGELLTFRTEAVRTSERRGGTDVSLRYLGGQDAMTARLAIALLSEASDEAASGAPEGDARAA